MDVRRFRGIKIGETKMLKRSPLFCNKIIKKRLGGEYLIGQDGRRLIDRDTFLFYEILLFILRTQYLTSSLPFKIILYVPKLVAHKLIILQRGINYYRMWVLVRRVWTLTSDWLLFLFYNWVRFIHGLILQNSGNSDIPRIRRKDAKRDLHWNEEPRERNQRQWWRKNEQES